MAKIIIIGPQCSGKTTLAALLRRHVRFTVIDEDDEINRRNGGKSPSDWTDWNYKWTVLRPQIQRDVLRMENIIFLASFFDEKLLLHARLNGFVVVQFVTRSTTLQERNRERMKRGVDDATYGWNINLPYHEVIRKQGLVDVVIETDRNVEEVCQEVIAASQVFGRRTQVFPRPYWVKR